MNDTAGSAMPTTAASDATAAVRDDLRNVVVPEDVQPLPTAFERAAALFRVVSVEAQHPIVPAADLDAMVGCR